jgi:hypothetical protein
VSKSGSERHVEQAALPARDDRRHAADARLYTGAVGRQQPQAAATLGDEHAAVRQERETPGGGQRRVQRRGPRERRRRRDRDRRARHGRRRVATVTAAAAASASAIAITIARRAQHARRRPVEADIVVLRRSGNRAPGR